MSKLDLVGLNITKLVHCRDRSQTPRSYQAKDVATAQ